MRDEDRKRIYGVYTSLGMEVPHKKINDLISISYSAVDKVGDEFFYYDRITGIEEHMEILIANMEKRSMDTIEKYGTGNKFEDVYRFCTKQVPNIHKSMIQRTYDIMSVNKKIAYLCVAQTKRALSRTTKINPSLKSRKINKELTFINKRFDKERKEQSKKAEREALEIKKQEEENKEVLRQRKKFEYLLSQTELFSQFMLGKKNIDHFDSNKEKDDELASLSKKFKEAAIKQKESKFNDQGEIEDKEPSNTTSNFIPQPKILNCELKNYQINGFNWLVKLYDKGINGILADDMGLGKTVQSISLLAYLGETEDNWGPFLIVTPASTLHNWEQEIKKFVPVFKILNYWGNSTLRAQMRNEIKSVNIVLTSYQIAVADYKILRKTKWMYMILDEAQAIKSSASKRWTTLLSFKTRNRLLLTGTPVQNTMSELWALLHFIMPTLFDSLSEFTEWFSKGIEESAERKKAVDEIQLQKLHAILKPFMLRRLKSDVKTELGIKKEMELFCELSPRQKIYYQSIVDACRSYEMENIIMQLRKVCNHPDLFEKLETTTKISLFKNEEEGQSVEMGRSKISIKLPSLIVNDAINTFEEKLAQRKKILNFLKIRCWEYINENNKCLNSQDVFAWIRFMWNNSLDYEYGNDFISGLSSLKEVLKTKKNVEHHRSYIEREMEDLIDKKIYDYSLLNPCTKNIVSTFPYVYSNETECPLFLDIKSEDKKLIDLTINDIVYIPPLNTFIIDSGKLKLLDSLLPNLKAEGHRILIYFQMTKMMDLVEDYLVKKEYSYCRLDGSSKISVRRDTVNDWQTGDKFIFLLSTRAGGLGINLTAADTVIFFDSDWNPTVDQQAMDRAYRIGQTKDVTVYRLITKNTIEERVMEKANKKGDLQKMVIKGKIFEGYEF